MIDQKSLRELENRCIQEHAPACTAACPLHLDVRGMLAAVQQGDFAAGLKLLRKSLPFPGIISHVCDQPCREVCKRGVGSADDGAPGGSVDGSGAPGAGIGGALAIAALEQACLAYGGPGDPITALPDKPKKVAVVGGGLSGMTVAYDLRRKGYRVTIFEAGSHLGGRLWDIPQERLPWPVILQDAAVLERLGVEILLNMSVGDFGSNGHTTPLARLLQQYDAVYLGAGADPHKIHDLVTDAAGQVQVDPQTYMTGQPGVFAGGSFLLSKEAGSSILQRVGLAGSAPGGGAPGIGAQAAQPPSSAADPQPPAAPWRSAILSVMDGRRAATSMDRYLQKVSLTAARANEGPYVTRLYTSLEGIAPAPLVQPADPAQGYSPAEAIREAQRCILCECMQCVKVCKYLEHYGGYPKKYVREIYNNLSIVMGTRFSNKFVNSCSLCGLCGEVCPEDLDMGGVIKQARQTMVAQKRMPPSAFDFALRDMAFSNGDDCALARTPPGAETCTVAFFPGCQLGASSPEYVRKVYAYLNEVFPAGGDRSAGQGVGLILRCCGAPAEWGGRDDLFQASQAEFLADYERMGRPKLVLGCSSCHQVFKTHFPQVEIVSLWEVIDQHGLPQDAASRPAPPPLAIHDPCATRYETAIHDSARRILDTLGCLPAELPLNRAKTECCSYGGLMWLANRELAAAVVERRTAQSPLDYVTYCTMCRDSFARQGKPSLHLLDLIYGEGDLQALAARPDPGYSQRHANRAHLKRAMLKEVWGEAMDEGKPYQSVRLIIPPDVARLLEERLILVEDLQQVIEYAERSGKKLLNKKTGRYTTHHKPGAVTYWVEYLPEGDGFVVFNAYSHRMEIGGGA